MLSGGFMKAGADYLFTKGKRDIKAKKKKKKGAVGLGGKQADKKVQYKEQCSFP